MQANRSLPLRLVGASILALQAGASASTWVVDDDGGPGVHFTDLPPAIAAAAPGDVLLVRAGSYSRFSVSSRLTIVAEPGATAFGGTGHPTVQGAGGRVVLAGLELPSLEVTDCAEPVVLDGLHVHDGSAGSNATVLVRNSADVRFLGCTIEGRDGSFEGYEGLRVDGSRVELISSNVSGGDGDDETNCNYAWWGGDGIQVRSGGELFSSLSSAAGGDGGSTTAFLCVADAGWGGDGLDLFGSSTSAVVSGSGAETFEGGDGGHLSGLGYCGDGGSGAYVGSAPLRHSGVLFVRGAAGCNSGWDGFAILGSGATEAVPADPTLERIGLPAPGSTVTFRVRGEPGASAQLFLGRRPIVTPAGAGTVGDQLVQKLRTIDLGPIPASGSIDRDVFLPPSWPSGMLFVGQASLDYAGETRRTNSTPVVLR